MTQPPAPTPPEAFSARDRTDPEGRSPDPARASPTQARNRIAAIKFGGVFAGLVLAILLIGAWALGTQREQLLAGAHEQVAAVNRLKLQQLADWRHERMADARVLAQSEALGAVIARWRATQSAADAGSILGTFRDLCENYRYAAVKLTDAAGRVLLSSKPTDQQLDAETAAWVERAVQARTPVFSDLHRDPESSFHLDVVAPMFASREGGSPLALVLILSSSADDFLFPRIRRWPTDARTGRTLLVRREGDRAIYLTPARGAAGAERIEPVPLSRTDAVVVRALQGSRGAVTGNDHRGVPVVAAANPVPGTSWVMISKIEEAEALADWRVQAGFTVSVVVLALLTTLGAAALLWSRAERRNLAAMVAAAAAREQSEDRLRVALESSAIGLWEVNLATSATYHSREVGELLGERNLPSDWSIERLADHVVAEDRERVRDELRDARTATARWTLECKVRDADGSLRWLAVIGRSFRDPAGTPVRMVGILQDISATKRTKEELREANQTLERRVQERTAALAESEDRFRRMADSAPVLMWVAGPDKGCTFFNQTWLDFTGRTLAQEQGMGWAEGVHPEDRERCWKTFAGAVDARRPFEMEYRLRRADGVYRTLFDRGTPRFAADGTFIGFIGACIDVTENKSAQEKLRTAAVRLAVATQAGHIGIFDCDFVQRHVHWDDEMLRLFGVPKNEFRSADESWQRALHPEDKERVEAEVQAALRGDRAYDTEFRIRWPNGTIRHLKAVANVWRDAAGNAVRMIGMNQDITERKEAEAARDDLFAETTDLIQSVGADGRIIYVNRAWREALGYRESEVLGLNVFQVIHPDNHAHCMREFGRLMSGADVGLMEVTFVTKGGAKVELEGNVSPRLKDGAVISTRGIFRDITPRKRAEAALRESESRFRAVFEAATVGIGLFGLNLKLESCNPALAAMLGYTQDEMLTVDTLEVFLPEDRAEVAAKGRRLVAGEVGSVISEDLMLRKDGTTLWTQRTTLALRGSDGRPFRIVTLVTDISHLKRAENLLRVHGQELEGQVRARTRELEIEVDRRRDLQLHAERLSRLYQVKSRVNEAIARAKDADGLMGDLCRAFVEVGGFKLAWIGWVNPATETVDVRAQFGDTVGFFAGLNVSTRADRPEGRGPAGRAIREGRTQVINDFLAEEGTRPWHERAIQAGIKSSTTVPVRHGAAVAGVLVVYAGERDYFEAEEIAVIEETSGNLTFALGFLDNRIENERAARRIREQADLLDQTVEVIVACDRDGKISFWNKAAEKLLGRSASDALGRPLDGILANDGKNAETGARQALAVWCDWHGEAELINGSAGTRVLDVSVTVLRDEDGEPAGRILVGADNSENKRLQEQFLRMQRLESLGSLASGLSHDLNNVLAPIGMGAAILKSRLADESSQKILTRIEGSVRRGADIIRQVLTFARGSENQRAPLQIRHLLREMAEIAEATFPPAIEVHWNTEKDLWPVLGDATQLHQVLMNLSVNARDAMPLGGRLTLEAHNHTIDAVTSVMSPGAVPGSYVRLQVSDTGTGIPPELLGRIFEPFFTTKEKGKGTGLGLATVFTVAKAHGGFVNVESKVGRGTTFEVFLPALPGVDGLALDVSRPKMPVGHGERILVVEDEVAIREAVVATLEENGYRVESAVDGIEGTALFVGAAEKFDAVVTDLSMPNMNGATMVRALLRIRSGLPVVGMTGAMDEADPKVLGGLGFAGFLHKPFTTEELLTTLDQALKAKATR